MGKSFQRRLFYVLIILFLLSLCSAITMSRNSVQASGRAHASRCSQEVAKLDSCRSYDEFFGFFELAIKDVSQHDLQKHQLVPRLSGLDLYLWDTDPSPIFMPYNDHLTFYDTNSNEQKIIKILRYVLSIENQPEDEIVVLDMGINDGYISALSAAYGYFVVSVDAQPECVRRFAFAKAVNRWRKVKVLNNIVLNEEKRMLIPNGVCGGGSRFLGKTPNLSVKRGVVANISGNTQVLSTTIDSIVPTQKVLFFHLDVEGAELSVLESASRLLREGRLTHLVWEFAPHRWNKMRDATRNLVSSLMSDFMCLDVRDVQIPITGFPRKNSNIIKDWALFYDSLEEKRTITDIWCYLKI
jgi:FkbM family methyltransferase